MAIVEVPGQAFTTFPERDRPIASMPCFDTCMQIRTLANATASLSIWLKGWRSLALGGGLRARIMRTSTQCRRDRASSRVEYLEALRLRPLHAEPLTPPPFHVCSDWGRSRSAYSSLGSILLKYIILIHHCISLKMPRSLCIHYIAT